MFAKLVHKLELKKLEMASLLDTLELDEVKSPLSLEVKQKQTLRQRGL